jgi:hypothetical protein
VEGRPAGVTRGRRNAVVAIVLLVGLVAGIVLVLTGGDDDGDASGDSTTTTAATGDSPAAEREPLPLEDTSQAAIAELTGLAFPPEATDFLTARLDDDRQLDITFVMPAAQVATFVSGSGLPEPVADERVVTHSSPLWKLNPEQGTALSGVADTVDGVDRAVELVSEADGTVRARIVITTAA